MNVVPSFPRGVRRSLLGNLREFRSDRVRLLRRAQREYGDVARLRMGLFTLLLVSSREGAHEVFVEKADAFRKSAGLSIFARPVLGDGLLTSEDGVHKRQRRMLAPVFAHKRIASYADVMVEKTRTESARLESAAREHREVDLAEELLHLGLDIVGKTLFDAEMAGHAAPIGEALTESMRQMMRSMLSVVPMPPRVPTLGNLRLRRSVETLDRIVYAMIRERRVSTNDPGDMLGMLLASRDADDGSSLNDREVRDQAMTIMLAGHETTAAALSWTFYLLGHHPRIREKVFAEVDRVLGERPATFADLRSLPFCLQVFKEAMRLYPPAYMVGRKADRDVVVQGTSVKKGQIVLINVMGIQRRTDVFPDPDRFDPDRFQPEREKALPAFSYLPFGGGPRICIGNQFALMQGHLVLATLSQRLGFELVGAARTEGPGGRAARHPASERRYARSARRPGGSGRRARGLGGRAEDPPWARGWG